MIFPAKYIILYLSFLVFGWFVLRILVQRDYKIGGRLSIPVTILQSLLFFIYGGFPSLYLPQDWPQTHVSSTLYYIGMAFIIVGLASLSYGMLKLGLLPSVGRDQDVLEQTGIYSISRNPQALASGIYVLGFTILWPSWYALSWMLLYVVLIQAMIITEEEHLLHLYGESYEEYCDNAPRYIGMPRKSKGNSI